MGFIYLIFTILTSCIFVKKFNFDTILDKRHSDVVNISLYFSISWLLGSIFWTYTHFFLGLIVSFLTENTMYLTSLLIIFINGVYLYLFYSRKKSSFNFVSRQWQQYTYKFLNTDFLILVFSLFFWGFFLWNGISEEAANIYLGPSIYWDFMHHFATVKSFSEGVNFMPQFPTFTDGTIRYHFFIASYLPAILDNLGMGLSNAFNVPSLFYFYSLSTLIYAFTFYILPSKFAAFLSVVFFIYRSSFAFFTFVLPLKNLTPLSILNSIPGGEWVIGKTQFEYWGIYSQKVFLNQRHLVFGMGLILFTILYFLKRNDRLTSIGMRDLKKHFRFNLERKSLFVFIFLFSLSFFAHGMSVASALLIMFFFGLLHRNKLEYLLLAICSIGCGKLLSMIFFGVGANVGSPTFYFGYLSKDKTILGLFLYYIELLGVLPLLALFSIYYLPKGKRYLALISFVPLILATFVKFGKQIEVNHKFINISVMIMNTFAAIFIAGIAKKSKKLAINIPKKLLVSVLICLMVISGLVDMVNLYRMDLKPHIFNQGEGVTNWFRNNTDRSSIVLTDPAVLWHPIQFSGRKLFFGGGWWSRNADYPWHLRKVTLSNILELNNLFESKKYFKINNINFFCIDSRNPKFLEKSVSIDKYKKNFPVVYSDHRWIVFKLN